MKKSVTTLSGLLGILLVLSPIHASSEGSENVFYGNPLILNGRSLDYNFFSKNSRGVLALVKGNPNSTDSPKVPFKIYLKHSGQIVNKGLSSDTHERYQVEVSGILALAQYGDELVIEPTRKSDAVAKRVIHLNKVDLMYMIFSPLFAKQKGVNDGC